MNARLCHIGCWTGLRRIQSVIAFLAVAAFVVPAMGQDPAEGKRDIPARVPITPGGTIMEEQDKEPATPPATYNPGDPAPVIKALNPIHDFGTTWAGPQLEATFRVTNEGTKPLDILKVRTSCGCTIAGRHPQKLMPGEVGEFPFAVNSNKLRGSYEKTAMILSNDPVTPTLKLKLRGVCNRHLDIMPTNANFGKLTGNAPQQRVIKITNNTDTPAKLSVEPEQVDNVNFKLVETEPGKQFELVVTVSPPFGSGMLNAGTVLVSNIEAQPRTDISARAKVPDRLEVSPEVITLNVDKDNGRPFKRPLRFRNYGEKPVKILEASIDDPRIKLSIDERTEGTAYVIYVEVPSGYQPTTQDHIITLKTDDPDQPEIKARFRATSETVAQQQSPTPQPRRPADEMIGQNAPSFSVKTLEGKEVSNQAVHDQVTVLDFFAPNCPHCKRQLPVIESLRKEYESKGVNFVAVSQTMRNKKYSDEEVVETVKSTGFEGDLATDHDNTVGPLFKATGFPTLVVLGKTGKVESVHVGNKGGLDDILKGELDALLAGKPIPASPKVAEAPRPQPPKQQANQVLGSPAPAFNTKTVAGAGLSNDDLQGRVTVLDFFAPNCPHCAKQLPRVEKIRKEYQDKGVRFVAVSQTMRQKFSDEDVLKKLTEAEFGGEVVIDGDNDLGPKFSATGFPTMAIVGKDGKVAALNVGNAGDLEERMKGQLDALVEGKPIPDQWVSKPTSQARPAEDMVGKPAPGFAITTLEQKPVGDAEFSKYKATVLNFVAPNCGFCKKQVPNVEKVRQEYEAKGVRFVNVAQKMRKDYSVEETAQIFKEVGSNLELATDFTNSVGQKYMATSFPTMVVVDGTGKIAHVNIGAKADIDAVLKGQLDTLIK